MEIGSLASELAHPTQLAINTGARKLSRVVRYILKVGAHNENTVFRVFQIKNRAFLEMQRCGQGGAQEGHDIESGSRKSERWMR
jgi:hypothetical protein